MKTLIGIWVVGLGWIFFLGQPRWTRTEPQTLEELANKKEKLLTQLESLKDQQEHTAFSQTIFNEITELDKQKTLLMGNQKH